MAETEQTKTTETADIKAVRARRAARLAKASNVAFSLEPKVRARLVALAKENGVELGHYLQKILELHVVEQAAEGDALAERLSAKRAVIDQVIALAQKMDAGGKFDEHFVLNVMQTAASDPAFMALYTTAIGGDDMKAVRAQGPLNQQLGRLIRKAVGAKGKRSAEGKVMRGQASGEIISAYTLLTKDA